MKASARPRADATITLADGRILAHCEWGEPTGSPVLLAHGPPGSRLLCPDEDTTVGAGVRLLTVDRPGYGCSDARPDPSLLGWADDVQPWPTSLVWTDSRWSGSPLAWLCAGLCGPDARAHQRSRLGLL